MNTVSKPDNITNSNIVTKIVPFRFFYGTGGFLTGISYNDKCGEKDKKSYVGILKIITVSTFWPIFLPILAFLEK